MLIVLNHQQDSNNNSKYDTREYIFCDGKNCNNDASFQLKIFYFKQPCWFCDTCKQNLERVGLVESNFDDDLKISVGKPMKSPAQPRKMTVSKKAQYKKAEGIA